VKKIAIIVLLLTASFACVRQSKSELSAVSSRVETSYVTDRANAIDAATRTNLENRLARLREQQDVDFAVVTVSSSGAEPAFDYSLKLARERGAAIGNQNSKGNLLLLVAVDDRKWHIQISRNLEAKLSNELLTELSSPMIESFKQKRWSEGISRYVDAIIAKL
jgi:uncharacterized protein